MSLLHTCFKCTDKDWDDIKFGVDNQVDYYAVSFVKDAQVVHELKDYLRSNHQSNFVKNHIMHLLDNLLSAFYSLLRLQCRHTCNCKDRKCRLHPKPTFNHHSI
jgi:hypothetical protein